MTKTIKDPLILEELPSDAIVAAFEKIRKVKREIPDLTIEEAEFVVTRGADADAIKTGRLVKTIDFIDWSEGSIGG